MAEVLRTRCAQGQLIVTDDDVRIELKGLPGMGGGPARQQVMRRAVITSVAAKVTMASLFGLGGAATVTIHGMGADVIRATLVPPKDAQRIVAVLSAPVGQSA